MVKVKLTNDPTLAFDIKEAIDATRTCYDSFHKSDSEGIYIGKDDKNLLRNIMKAGHYTPFEFIQLKFSIEDLTRAILQELVRHRTATYNVKSSRYTLKRMKDDVLDNLDKYFYTDLPMYKEYLVMIFNFIEENNLWELPNDKLKFYMPESLYCDLRMTINFRNFIHFHKLRSSDHAHFLIRDLAEKMYGTLSPFLKELADLSEV